MKESIQNIHKSYIEKLNSLADDIMLQKELFLLLGAKHVDLVDYDFEKIFEKKKEVLLLEKKEKISNILKINAG